MKNKYNSNSKINRLFRTNYSLFQQAIAIGFFLAGSLHAEVVLFRDGKTETGRVINQNPSHIQFRTEKETKWILKDNILKVKYTPFTEEEKKQQFELARKNQVRLQAERERIAKERLDRAERQRELKKLEIEELAEKMKEAKEQSERAAALRELVAKGQMVKPDGEMISYWDFAWRSMVVPGWGHFKIDRPVMGSLYLVTVAALLANTYTTGKIAFDAEKENHRQVEMNYYLYLQPQLAPFEVRTAYAINSNADALTAYKSKVDNYHQSLYALEIFYGIQLVHIIYNGIAWENGLLIVNAKTDDGPVAGTIRTDFLVLPDRAGMNTGQGGRGNMARLGMTYYF